MIDVIKNDEPTLTCWFKGCWRVNASSQLLPHFFHEQWKGHIFFFHPRNSTWKWWPWRLCLRAECGNITNISQQAWQTLDSEVSSRCQINGWISIWIHGCIIFCPWPPWQIATQTNIRHLKKRLGLQKKSTGAQVYSFQSLKRTAGLGWIYTPPHKQDAILANEGNFFC